MLASCRGVYNTSTWCGPGLAGNVNSVIGGYVSGDNLWSGSATVDSGRVVTEGKVVRIPSRVNG